MVEQKQRECRCQQVHFTCARQPPLIVAYIVLNCRFSSYSTQAGQFLQLLLPACLASATYTLQQFVMLLLPVLPPLQSAASLSSFAILALLLCRCPVV